MTMRSLEDKCVNNFVQFQFSSNESISLTKSHIEIKICQISADSERLLHLKRLYFYVVQNSMVLDSAGCRQEGGDGDGLPANP